MAGRPKTKHSLPRRCLRWFRISVLLIIIALLSVVLWSNYVGIPEFIASIVRKELRAYNIAFDFTRLRLEGFRRIVAEQLHITPTLATNASRVEIAKARLLLKYDPSKQWPIAISGLHIDNGQIALAVNNPGEPERYVSITNLQAELEFREGDLLRIRGLSGEAFGAKANISGVLRNFSKFQPAASQVGDEKHWHEQLAEIADIAQQLTFAVPPELTVDFTTDAADLTQSRGSITLRAEEASSRWGNLRKLRVTSGLYPLTNEPAVKGTFRFDLEKLESASGGGTSFHAAAQTVWSKDMQQLLTNHLELSIAKAQTEAFAVTAVRAELASSQREVGKEIISRFISEASSLNAGANQFGQSSFQSELRHALPFPTPARFLSTALASLPPPPQTNLASQNLSGEWSFQSAKVKLRQSEGESIRISGEVLSQPTPGERDPALSFWEYLRPFALPWQLQVSNLVAGDAKIRNLTSKGQWIFPELDVQTVEAELYNGKLTGEAHVDVRSRQFSAHTESTFNYHLASILLEPQVQHWLEQFAWENPPRIRSEIAFLLPPWTNSWERFGNTILPSLNIAGSFEGRGSFRGVPLGMSQSQFSFSNYVWNVPELRITRPEGQATVNSSGNVTNQNFSARIISQINPGILAPMLDTNQQPALEFVRFSTPPQIHAEIRGNLDKPSGIIATGSITATNFFIKEQAMTDLKANFAFKDTLIEVKDLIAHRGKEQLTAPYLKIDLPNEVMFVTNAISTIDPYVAMSLVGEDTYQAIDPYRFANAPRVTIDGIVPLREVSKADLHFGVSGTDFSYWRFHLPSLSGDVFWRGDHLSFSNIQASFYGGGAEWSASFLIDNKTDSATFSFRGFATNASLHPLVKDLFGATNRLEGQFSGELIITSASTSDIKSWNGNGNANLREGYLWSVPIFGVFSPVLDSISPGLGSPPVSSGAGTFTVQESVIHTRDLQVRAPAFRLNYNGKVDLSGKLEARVEAELLRDTWIVGKLFSAALWPVAKAFEAKVTGTLDTPKTQLRFVPGFVSAPFRMLGSLREAAKAKEERNKAPVTEQNVIPDPVVESPAKTAPE